mgnify:FL=1
MDSSAPLVSIITITRNRANLIHRAIESIQNQTYENFEHIIVDGNSEDNTHEVVKSYGDERINYIKLSQYGPIIQLKAGIEVAKGKYITFLDDDDEYLPTKIEKQVVLIESLPAEYGFVYCWMDYFDDATKQYLYTHKAELRGFVGDDVVSTPTVSGTPTYFFRRNVFDEMGGWRSDIGIISDWELAARTCQRYKVDYVPESLVKVYVNHGVQRMSDNGYYRTDYWPRALTFANHFLSEFSDVFARFPSRSVPHLYMASRSCFAQRKWKEGWRYYKKLIRLKPSVKNLLLIPYSLFR